MPDGTIKVLVEGAERANVINYSDDGEFFTAEISVLQNDESEDEKKLEVSFAFHH